MNALSPGQRARTSTQVPSCQLCPTRRESSAEASPLLETTSWWPWLRIALAAYIAGNSMVIALCVNLTEEVTVQTRWMIHLGLMVATAVVLALVGTPLLRGLWVGLARRRVSMEMLFVLAALGAAGYSLVSVVRQTGAVYFEVISILLVIYALGREVKTLVRSRVSTAALQWAPESSLCWCLSESGVLQQRSVAEVLPGTQVRVFPGQTIPIDGQIEQGQALIRQAEMTGEPLTEARGPGDNVWAATTCLDGTLTIRASTSGDARRIDWIVRAVAAARQQGSSMEDRARRLTTFFLPAVVLAALGTLIGWGAFSQWDAGVLNSLAVLVVACPCALGVATPLAVWSSLAALARLGMICKSGEVVRRLAEVDLVAYDKTGTLTNLEGELTDLELLDSTWTAEQLLALVAAAERACDHPFAQVLAQASTSQAYRAEQIEILPGRGIRAQVVPARPPRAPDGSSTKESSPETLSRETPSFQPTSVAVLQSRVEGQRSMAHHLDIVIDGQLVGRATVQERIRGRWDNIWESWKQLGVSWTILSGDRTERVLRLFQFAATTPQEGFPGHERRVTEEVLPVQGGLLPEQKHRQIQSWQKAGRRVVFVGDGVNDAAALATADVGVAVAEGTPLACEAGDVIWSGADPASLPQAVVLCRRAMRLLETNLFFAVGYNSVGVAAAAAGWLHPAAAAVLMLVSSLTVTIRAGSLLTTEDSSTEDSGTEDSGTEDSGTEDSGTEDSGTEDSGTEKAGNTTQQATLRGSPAKNSPLVEGSHETTSVVGAVVDRDSADPSNRWSVAHRQPRVFK